MSYSDFLRGKEQAAIIAGFDADESTYPALIKDHQRVGVTWALRRGRAALFFDTGLGKTLAQLTWADQVAKHTGRPVLLLAPLAVSKQTKREGDKFGIDCQIVVSGDEIQPGVNITNYEKLHHFDCAQFSGVVLDESSILKGLNGKLRKRITESFSATPYRLSCTATPSPNDHMELGTQSEFLGIMSQVEMLAMFFIHDGGDTSKWRMKGHGKAKFFEWLSTWAMFLSSPAQLGFDGDEYTLPPIQYHSHIIETEPTDSLFVEPAQGLLERNRARKETVEERCRLAADIANALDEPCVIWCNLNDESKLLADLADGAVEVTGSDSDEHKVDAVMWFTGADEEIKLIDGKLVRDGKCGNQNTQKTDVRNMSQTLNTGNAENNRQDHQSRKKNTCVSTQKETLKNSDELPSNKRNTTKDEGRNTQKTKNTEKSKNQTSLNTDGRTQNHGSRAGLDNTGSRLTTTEGCLMSNQEDAPYVDHRTQGAQSEKGCMLTTATQQAVLEGCCAQTATKVSGNSRTAQKCLRQQSVTSKKVLISKPKIFGYGLNFQSSRHCIFVGLSDSWEAFYQAIRRQWRFGQAKTVHVHIVSADVEGAVVENIQRKDAQHEDLKKQMDAQFSNYMRKEIFGATIEKTDYLPAEVIQLPGWLVSESVR